MELSAGGEDVLPAGLPHRSRNARVLEDALESRDLRGARRFKGNVTGWIEREQIHLAVPAPKQARQGLGVLILVVHVPEEDVFVGHPASARRRVGIGGGDDILERVLVLDGHELAA